MSNWNSRLVLFLIFCFIFLVPVSQALSQKPDNQENQWGLPGQNEKPSGYRIQNVDDNGFPHQIPGLGEGGISGICPQKRNTPTAPKPFLMMTNPLEPTLENLRDGEMLFEIDARPTACKVCHGFGGDGLGIIFERLQPKPRNFTCYYTMEDISDGQIYWIIKNGSPGTPMPSFGALSDRQVWQLVLYVRQFAQKEISK